MPDRPVTVEEFDRLAILAAEDGYDELATIFSSLSTKVAQFNERSPYTLEQIRHRIGNDEFFRLLSLSRQSFGD